ncbi:MAG: LCP family protein [Oscillospiraceae bacterium]|nr:LCP family protein [Oscillospiraceae bacterium]MBR0452136.1 LCP family protein [Oscillospiraceae bacterium]
MAKEKTKKNTFIRLLVVLAVFALIGIGVKVLLQTKPASSGEEIDERIQTPKYLRDQTMTVLVAGIDYEEGRTVANTDVIMVVNIDLQKGKMNALQIPRDTYVGETLVKYGKINGLYNWGIKDGDGTTGISVLADVIYDQFKLTIDNYACIDMDVFPTLVDMLGGVEVTLDEDITLNEGTVLEAGTHLLDGATSENFVRNRDYALADITRLKMQRYFFGGLLNKLFNTPKMELLSLITACYDYIDTDFTVQEILQLALTAQKFSASDFQVVRVPGEPVSRYGIYGLDVWTLHKEKLANILNEYMRPYTDDVLPEDLGVIELQHTTDILDDEVSNMDDYT